MTKTKLFSIEDDYLGVASCERFVDSSDESCGRSDRPDLIFVGVQSLAIDCNRAAVVNHLAGNQERAREYGQRVAPAARGYFSGDWRTKVPTDDKKIDPTWWRSRESWADSFRYGICWAMVLDDWQSVQELAAYPDHDRSMEEVDDEMHPARRHLLISLAEYLRGEKVSDVAAKVGKLKGARWRATIKLAEALDSIVAEDAATTQMSLTDFFDAHHKRMQKSIREREAWAKSNSSGMSNDQVAKVQSALLEAGAADNAEAMQVLIKGLVEQNKRVAKRPSGSIIDTISIDGTIMYYLARHAGLDVVLQPKLYVYVIDLNCSESDGA